MNKYVEKQIVAMVLTSTPLLRVGAETGMFYRARVNSSVGEAKMPSVLELVS